MVSCETSNKNFILDVGMEKEQKQGLGWRVSVLPIPAFHDPLYTVYLIHNIISHSGGMQEQIPSIPILVSVLFPSLHLKYFRIKCCVMPSAVVMLNL